MQGPTVVVMDNASIHTSEAFQEAIPKWEKKGLSIFYLPEYSPELNLIEILWRFMKYEWIEFWAYKYLSICFFIALSWLFVGVEQGKMKLLLLRYIPALLIWSNMWKRSSRILAKNI